jgi:oligopeptide/dipeptide ABC transporter ATP-binding protein
VTLQAQIVRLINDLRAELHTAVLLITHDLGLVAELCERMYVMYASRIVEHGPVAEIFAGPRHPYTRALLESTLSIEQPREFIPIAGQPPDLLDPPSGCRFHPRCPRAMDRCRAQVPQLSACGGSGAAVACWAHHVSGEEV